MDDVTISGPTSGLIQSPQTFTASVSPITSTAPVTYVWQASNLAPIMHTGGVTDTADFTWLSSGVKAITVTASNMVNTVTDTHTITIEAWANTAPITNGIALYGKTQCPDDPNRFYVIGGMLDDLPIPPIYTDEVWRYDASTDMWEELAPLPGSARYAISVACYEGKLYAAGGGRLGQFTTNLFYIYDITTDNWTPGPLLPRLVISAGLGAWDGFLYLIGGDDANFIPISPETQVDRYDIQNGVWEAIWGSPMPAATLASWVQAGPYVYMAGGYTSSFPNNSSLTMRYDMSTDTWGTGQPFTSRRAAFAMAATETYLYAIGGDENVGGTRDVTTLVERLDHTNWPTSTWQDAGTPLAEGLLANSGSYCTEALTGGEVWSLGGELDGQIVVSTNQYRPAEPCFVFTPTYTMTLSPLSAAAAGPPGAVLTFDLIVTNMGNVGDNYTVTVGESGWTTTVSAPSIGPLGSGVSETIQVGVTISLEALDGDFDTVAITVTSYGDPTQSVTSTLTTTSVWYKQFLPLTRKD
jgi:hypothetical protein